MLGWVEWLSWGFDNFVKTETNTLSWQPMSWILRPRPRVSLNSEFKLVLYYLINTSLKTAKLIIVWLTSTRGIVMKSCIVHYASCIIWCHEIWHHEIRRHEIWHHENEGTLILKNVPGHNVKGNFFDTFHIQNIWLSWKVQNKGRRKIVSQSPLWPWEMITKWVSATALRNG